MEPFVLLVAGTLGCFGVREPKIHHLSFSNPKMAFSKLPKTLHFKGKMSNVDAKNTINLRKKRQTDKWFHFHTWSEKCKVLVFL